MTTLYTFGYLAGNTPRVIKELSVLHIPLVDVRFSPRSKRPEWQQESLQARPELQYHHIRALGNELYQEALTGRYSEPHIRLHNKEQGIEELAAILRSRGQAAIFCACNSKKTCHRIEIARLAQEHIPGLRIVHL